MPALVGHVTVSFALLNSSDLPGYPYAAADESMFEVRYMFEVNLFGVMAMTKAFIPLLIASGSGCVVNVGSIAALAPVPFASTYSASKAALHAYSDTLCVELAPFNIRVLTIAAGTIQSNITKRWNPVDIPQGSIYELVREYQDLHIDHHSDAAPRQPVVARIVRKVLKANPTAWLWIGQNSFTTWLMKTFLWRTVFDTLMSKMFSLDITKS